MHIRIVPSPLFSLCLFLAPTFLELCFPVAKGGEAIILMFLKETRVEVRKKGLARGAMRRTSCWLFSSFFSTTKKQKKGGGNRGQRKKWFAPRCSPGLQPRCSCSSRRPCCSSLPPASPRACSCRRRRRSRRSGSACRAPSPPPLPRPRPPLESSATTRRSTSPSTTATSTRT